MTQHANLINGQWAAAKCQIPNTNPSELSDVIGDYAQGDAADVDNAVAAAAAAFPAWSTSGIRPAMMRSTRSAPKFWPARKNWVRCWHVKKARPRPKVLAKSAALARSSSSSPVNACG